MELFFDEEVLAPDFVEALEDFELDFDVFPLEADCFPELPFLEDAVAVVLDFVLFLVAAKESKEKQREAAIKIAANAVKYLLKVFMKDRL